MSVLGWAILSISFLLSAFGKVEEAMKPAAPFAVDFQIDSVQSWTYCSGSTWVSKLLCIEDGSTLVK